VCVYVCVYAYNSKIIENNESAFKVRPKCKLQTTAIDLKAVLLIFENTRRNNFSYIADTGEKTARFRSRLSVEIDIYIYIYGKRIKYAKNQFATVAY